MAIHVTEFRDSRKLFLAKDTEKVTLEFVGFGSLIESDMWTAFDAAIPASVPAMTGTLPRLEFQCQTIGGGFWTATATYSADGAPVFPGMTAGPIPAAPGLDTVLGPDFSFDFTGVQEHITQSKQTLMKVRRGAAIAPDTKRAIGVTKDGEVQGCDRISPNLEWERSVTFRAITTAYIQTVKSLVGSTNNAPFYGHPAGSLIFTGGTAQTRDLSRAVCTFKFLARDNEEGIIIDSGIPAVNKRGSDYLWVFYVDSEDQDMMIQRPEAVYVERIVDEKDFSLLRIGA